MAYYLNLPRHIRATFDNVWLVGTVPGNGIKEPNNWDPYLSILVDEMLELTNKELFDAYQQATFILNTDILLYVLDYLGISKVFNTKGANASQGCTWCKLEGMYIDHCSLTLDAFSSM